MRKIAIILAGAAAFDLGVVVVSSHAAPDMFLKMQGPTAEKTAVAPAFYKFKIDLINTVKACKAGGGQVVKVSGVDQCHTRRAPLPSGSRTK